VPRTTAAASDSNSQSTPPISDDFADDNSATIIQLGPFVQSDDHCERAQRLLRINNSSKSKW